MTNITKISIVNAVAVVIFVILNEIYHSYDQLYNIYCNYANNRFDIIPNARNGDKIFMH